MQMEDEELHILIIDNNREDIAILLRYLEGYPSPLSVSHVVMAEEAIERLKHHRYDVCLVDIHLPGMGGIEFIRHILAHGDNLPTIVITEGGDEKTAARAIKLGAYDYLLKNEIDAALLNKTIFHALEDHGNKRENERLQRELESYAVQLENEISVRKQAEETLQKAHQELELRVSERTAELKKVEDSLVEAQRIARLGNWDWDIRKNTLWWSDEIYRIFGLEPKEVGVTYEAFLNSVHPDDRALVIKAVDEALYAKHNYSIDHRIIRPDGVVRICHEKGEATYNDGGKPIKSAPHIFEALKPAFEANPDFVYDGELYASHLRDDFEKLISLAKKTKPTAADLEESAKNLQYWVYDIVTDEAFGIRSERLNDIVLL